MCHSTLGAVQKRTMDACDAEIMARYKDIIGLQNNVQMQAIALSVQSTQEMLPRQRG